MKTQTGHTTGPWENHMEPMGGWIGPKSDAVISCDGHGAPSPADARLIAAAPCLLEALQEARTFVRGKHSTLSYGPKVLLDKIEQAINKATGKG